MQPTPPGWPRLSSALFYNDAAKAIDWLCTAFGFEVRLRVNGPDGQIVHSELTLGGAVIMAASAKRVTPGREHFPPTSGPAALGGVNTQSLFLYIDDVQAHHDHARAAGSVILQAPTISDHGPDYWTDKSYATLDLEGHLWYFGERLSTSPAWGGSQVP